MAASATFDFDHVAGEATAHILGATIGDEYKFFCFDPSSSSVTVTAVSSSFDIVVTGIGGFGAGEDTFGGIVVHVLDGTYVGTTVFDKDANGEFTYGAAWTYDGVDTVTVTFVADVGVTYKLDIFNDVDGQSGTPYVGTGVLHTLSTTKTGGTFAGRFIGELFQSSGDYNDFTTRGFAPGTAGIGTLGNPLRSPVSGVIVTLDGIDVTNCCVAGNWTRRLNRPSTAQIRVPMDCASAAVGTLLKIEALVGTTYEIVHHGRVLLVETDTGEDFGYTTYNSTDPMELWQWRPVRDDTCDFSDPTIIDDYQTGPQIIEDALQNTVYCGDGSQADTEGPIFLDMGTFAGGGVALTGAPTDWPMTIAELASLLISTGELDLVITPTDPGGGVMGTIDGYNGDFGTDLSATIVFSYGMGDFNVRRLRWNQDMTTMANKLWYYGGPKIATAADPAAVQHWCFNVTGDDPMLAYPPGGALSPPASATNNQLGVLRASSETTYGVRMDIQIFDAYDECAGVGTVGRELFRRRWQQESWLRAVPREIIHITPTRETEIGTFDIGDLVGVEAVAAVRGGFSGVQRVYEYTVSWDQDGVLELSELQTSADNEGL